MSFESGERYNVRVVSAALARSSAKGTLSAHIVFENPENGDQIPHDVWLTEKTAESGRAAEDLFLIGFRAGKDNFEDIGKITRGQECSIYCELEPSNNPKFEDRLRVKWMNPKIAATDETPEEVANRMFGMTAPVREVVKPRSNKASAQVAVQDDDEDVPF